MAPLQRTVFALVAACLFLVGPIQASGVTEWELSNGARVVLEATTFKQDEIVFRAVSPGGHSLRSWSRH